MSKKILENITLVGADSVDIDRLILAADICEKDFQFKETKLLTNLFSDDPRVIPIDPISSIQEYSNFCITKLVDYIDTEYALVIQYDGFILNPHAWTDEFLNYDYIGAPWHELGGSVIGNGGFSLRSKKLMTLLKENYERIGGNIHPEDMWISKVARQFLESQGLKFAPPELASRFSIEGDKRKRSWTDEFGFHGLRWTDISLWLKDHPEYPIINPCDLE